jgi:ribosomal protein L37AE/L43A
MPKSGSTLLANYQETLLRQSGVQHGQEQLRAAFDGRYIDRPTLSTLSRLIWMSRRCGDVVVKNHWTLTTSLKSLVRFGLAKVTMTYRDPRDIILSSIDHGRRSREAGMTSGGFVEYRTVQDAIPLVQALTETFDRWNATRLIHAVRYEDLISNPCAVIVNMIDFLNWDICELDVLATVEKLSTNREQSLNFNKGTTQRWRTEMSESEQRETTQAFEPFLERMGYET